MRTHIIAAALLVSGIATAAAADPRAGMYLCRSPLISHNFFHDLTEARRVGIRLDQAIAKSIADKNECEYVFVPNMRPVRFVAGQLAISDGTPRSSDIHPNDSRITPWGIILGWTHPDLYIMHVNAAPVR
jgi:hypothetical protein